MLDAGPYIVGHSPRSAEQARRLAKALQLQGIPALVGVPPQAAPLVLFLDRDSAPCMPAMLDLLGSRSPSVAVLAGLGARQFVKMLPAHTRLSALSRAHGALAGAGTAVEIIPPLCCEDSEFAAPPERAGRPTAVVISGGDDPPAFDAAGFADQPFHVRVAAPGDLGVIRESDIFLATQDWPVPELYDAMALGITVVGPASLEGVIVSGVSGVTVAPGDWRSLMQAAAELAVSPARRQTMGEQAQYAVAELCDPDEIVQRYARLLGFAT